MSIPEVEGFHILLFFDETEGKMRKIEDDPQGLRSGSVLLSRMWRPKGERNISEYRK
jgi:hypothetical protein